MPLTKTYKGLVNPVSNLLGIITGGEIASNGAKNGEVGNNFTVTKTGEGTYLIEFDRVEFKGFKYLVTATAYHPDAGVIASVTSKGEYGITVTTSRSSGFSTSNVDSAFSFLIIPMGRNLLR